MLNSNPLELTFSNFAIPDKNVGLLSTSQFVGVCGGNILDDDHLHAFKSTLLLSNDARERDRLKGRKIAATFFFREHVVALHVVRDDDGNTWIELIDSLPDPKTWNDNENDLQHNAVRVRCTDDEISFNTLIRHYVYSKLSKVDREIIDGTAWEDNNVESDPRVFQAFIWASDNPDADATVEFADGVDSLSDTDDEANIVSSMSSCSSGEKSGNIELRQKDDEIRALRFFLKHRNDQLKEIQAGYDDIIDQLKKENESLKEKLYPNNLIRPYQTGNHPDGTTDEEGETTKKSALDDNDVTSEKFDGYVASYLKDVFAKRQ